MKVFYSFFVLSFLLDFCLCDPLGILYPYEILPTTSQCVNGLVENYLDSFGAMKFLSKIIDSFTSSFVDKNDVKFFLYIRDRNDGKTGPTEINSDSLQNYSNEYGNFNTRKNIIIIHGFASDSSIPEIELLRKRFFENGDYNIIVVDWKAAQLVTQLAYQAVVKKLDDVALHVANLLRSIEKNGMGHLNETTIVGHSMGAHIAGIASHKLRGQIGRIVGLDPAGPLFSLERTHQRLSEDDAMEVEVIHTNIKGCGSDIKMGHYDFYVNGGKSQPGCKNHLCSHSRAYQYFAESLEPKSKGFYGKLCDDKNDVIPLPENCHGEAVLMGGLSKKHAKPGKYYVKIDDVSPYARGE